MKKLIFLLAFFSILTKAFNQQIEAPKMEVTKQEYLKKSKSQIITGTILLSGGAILIGAGLSTILENGIVNLFEQDAKKNNSGEVLTVLGIISIGGSIPYLFQQEKINEKLSAYR